VSLSLEAFLDSLATRSLDPCLCRTTFSPNLLGKSFQLRPCLILLLPAATPFSSGLASGSFPIRCHPLHFPAARGCVHSATCISTSHCLAPAESARIAPQHAHAQAARNGSTGPSFGRACSIMLDHARSCSIVLDYAQWCVSDYVRRDADMCTTFRKCLRKVPELTWKICGASASQACLCQKLGILGSCT